MPRGPASTSRRNIARRCAVTEALTHVTLGWHAPTPRRTLFYKFSPTAVSWSSEYFSPTDFAGYSDVTDRMLATLEPPNARYPGRYGAPEWKAEGGARL